MPGFTAEASLGRARQSYWMAAGAAPSVPAIEPAQSRPVITFNSLDLFRQNLVRVLRAWLAGMQCNRACWQQLYLPCRLQCHFDPFPRQCREDCCNDANALCCPPGVRLTCPDEIPIGG